MAVSCKAENVSRRERRRKQHNREVASEKAVAKMDGGEMANDEYMYMASSGLATATDPYIVVMGRKNPSAQPKSLLFDNTHARHAHLLFDNMPQQERVQFLPHMQFALLASICNLHYFLNLLHIPLINLGMLFLIAMRIASAKHD